MADLLHSRSPERAFPVQIETMVERVAAQRREFLTNNPFMPNLVRPTIRESWQRCAALIEPEREVVPLVIAGEREMQALYEKNDAFLKASDAVVRRLSEFLAGSGFTLALADARGVLLRVSGDTQTLSGLESIGLAPGCDWSEANAGTNGIGTALATGRAVRVIGPEHYCNGWQNITCITTPIRNPWLGEIVGLLDLSGDYHLVQPFFTGILAAAALEIRENLRASLAPGAAAPAPFQLTLPASAMQARRPRPSPPEAAGSRGQLLPADAAGRSVSAERLAITAGMISASLDFETTISQVVEHAAQLLDADMAAVCLLDDADEIDRLRVRASSPANAGALQAAVGALVKQSELALGVLESGEPVVIDDVDAAPQLHIPAVLLSGMRTCALLPLQGAQRVRGFLLAARATPYAWQPDDLRLGLSLAYQAATALDNARLYQTLAQHHRRLEALNAVNQVLTSMFDPAQQLDLIIQRIVEILKVDWGAIWIFQPGSAQNPPGGASLDAPHAWPRTFGVDLEEIGAKIAQDGAPLFFCCRNRPELPPARTIQAAGICDLFFAQLAAGVDLFGYLAVASSQHRELDEEDLALVTNIGRQLGLVLKNAQLQHAAGEAHVLRQADRIKSDFLMMVSHDLRSPLTAIRASVDGLLDPGRGHSSESQAQLLKNIGGQAKRLDRLVGRLLDLLRIEAGELRIDPDWTEMGALVIDTVAKFERLNAPCRVGRQIAEDLPLVYVDPEYMVQVLWNLLENAYKYSPSASRITVSALAINGEVFLRVADRGPGIPAEERQKIFQNFYRLSRDQQMHVPGSGLGLAICRGIVEAHGGRIWVEDRPDGGSVFCVGLPPFLPPPTI